MRWGMQSWDYSQKFVTLPECWQRDFCLAPCNMVLIINPLRILVLTWKILKYSHRFCASLSAIGCTCIHTFTHAHVQLYSHHRDVLYIYPYIHTRICMSRPPTEELWIRMITNVSISDASCWSHLMERSVMWSKMLFEILAVVIMFI